MQTPYYEIQEQKLDADIALLQNALQDGWGNNFIAACSVKTNSLPWLLNHYRQNDFWAEVVSSAEYDLTMRIGFDPAKVIYNGPIKDREVFKKVLLAGGLVNLDSSKEPEWLEEMSSENSGEVLYRVGLRINVDYAKLVPSEVPADEEGSRFGYSEENGELERVIERLRKIPGVQIAGLHLHSSTKSRSVTAYAAVAAYAVELAKRYQLNDLTYIDMGGGFYGGVAGKPDFRDYVPAIAGRLREYFAPEKVTLILEPGVSMVSSSFSFVTSVRDVKNIGEHVYVVTDGSRVNLNPQVTRRWYPHHFDYRGSGEGEQAAEAVPTKTMAAALSNQEKLQINETTDAPGQKAENAGADDRRMLPSQMICGATCMEYDRLFEIQNEPELRIGDRVIYDLAGGYTICLTPLFIHYFPAVMVKKADGSTFTAREPWTNDEFLAKNHWEG